MISSGGGTWYAIGCGGGCTDGKGRAFGVGGLERQSGSPGEDMEGGGDWEVVKTGSGH